MQKKQGGDEYIGQWYQIQHHIQGNCTVESKQDAGTKLRQLSKKIVPGLFMKITVLLFSKDA